LFEPRQADIKSLDPDLKGYTSMKLIDLVRNGAIQRLREDKRHEDSTPMNERARFSDSEFFAALVVVPIVVLVFFTVMAIIKHY
jgi:hypothetical protein